ncbi:MAG: hypothetical protein ABL900_09975 [Burkholderiaceae bacterium]
MLGRGLVSIHQRVLCIRAKVELNHGVLVSRAPRLVRLGLVNQGAMIVIRVEIVSFVDKHQRSGGEFELVEFLKVAFSTVQQEIDVVVSDCREHLQAIRVVGTESFHELACVNQHIGKRALFRVQARDQHAGAAGPQRRLHRRKQQGKPSRRSLDAHGIDSTELQIRAVKRH